MTTWNAEVARELADKLHDINFYLSIARVNLLNGHDEQAAAYVAAAVAAKDAAVGELPPIKLDDDDEMEFSEFYPFFWHKDLLMHQAASVAASTQNPNIPDNPLHLPWEHIERELRSAAESLRPLLDRPWPTNPLCDAKLEDVIDSIVRAADFLRDNPADGADRDQLDDGIEQLEEAQKSFLECAYPNSPVSMFDVLGQFNAMNLWLIYIYSAIQAGTPTVATGANRVQRILSDIGIVEAFKANLIIWLDEAFEGVNKPFDGWDEGTPGVIPGIDPIPGLPGHASADPRKGEKGERPV